MDLGLLGKKSTVVLDRDFVDGSRHQVKFRGLGRFFRNMREAGFSRIEYSKPLKSVNAITEFTRELGSVRDYINVIVARDPGHIRLVRKGFEVIGEKRFAAVLVVLERLSSNLGGSAAMVQAARQGDTRFDRIDAALKSLDWDAMTEARSRWLHMQPDVLILDADVYRDAMIVHTNSMRADVDA